MRKPVLNFPALLRREGLMVYSFVASLEGEPQIVVSSISRPSWPP